MPRSESFPLLEAGAALGHHENASAARKWCRRGLSSSRQSTRVAKYDGICREPPIRRHGATPAPLGSDRGEPGTTCTSRRIPGSATRFSRAKWDVYARRWGCPRSSSPSGSSRSRSGFKPVPSTPISIVETCVNAIKTASTRRQTSTAARRAASRMSIREMSTKPTLAIAV